MSSLFLIPSWSYCVLYEFFSSSVSVIVICTRNLINASAHVGMMTVCIAALCEGGKKIVLAANRMIVIDNAFALENGGYKFEALTDNCAIMSAGSITLRNDILNEIPNDYSSSFSLEKVLFFTYLARKNAERAPSVGRETDIAIISNEGIKTINISTDKNGQMRFRYDRLMMEQRN